MAAPPIRLVVSDVDGTLVTTDKRLTPVAIEAVRAIEAAGARFTLISSRPPRGHGGGGRGAGGQGTDGGFQRRDGLRARPERCWKRHHLDAAAAAARGDRRSMEQAGVGVWADADGTWRLKDPDGPHVDHEHRTIGFGPTVVTDFDDVMGRIDKIVGVSDDHPNNWIGSLTAN